MSKKYNFVYITTNLINNKKYVGCHQTNIIEDNYIGSGRYFLKAVKKYGKKNFKREILKKCETIREANLLEEYFIKKYNTLIPAGYNLAPMGGLGFVGAEVSEETRKKISEKQKGISKLKYFLEKYGEEGNQRYLDYKNNINNLLSNRKCSNETKQLMRDHCASKRIEVKEKISKANKNKKRSEETKKRIGAANKISLKGKKQSEETIKKRADKHRGTHHSEETKIKMSLSAKGKPKNYSVWNKHKTKLNINHNIIEEIKLMALNKNSQKNIAILYNLSISSVARIIKGFYDRVEIEQILRGK